MGFLLTLVTLGLIWYSIQAIWDSKNFGLTEGTGIFENLDARQALYIFEHVDGIVPVDTRTRTEYAESHIPQAVSAPYSNHDIDRSDLESVNRDTPLLVYCEGGYHSRLAIEKLKGMGFKTIYHINRGFISWKFFGGSVEAGA